MNKFKIGILGVPFDHGVKLINGRPGARFAPEKVKKEFFKVYNKIKKTNQNNKITNSKKSIGNVEIIDYGNAKIVKEDCAKTHENVAIVVRNILKEDIIPIVIGGSHDLSFGSGKALGEVFGEIGQINIDAHYDVRPVVDGKITSGTPFRRLLESGILDGKSFVEFGAHAKSNSDEHHQYLVLQKASIMNLRDINGVGLERSIKKALLITSKKTKALSFDIDIDAIKNVYAPGRSAKMSGGFTKKQMMKAAYLAGKNKKVKLFNLMEVNPKFDVKNKTVKLAAELIVEFIRGVKERK